MTDARFPERWLADRRLARISDPAFRLFAVALVWTVANRTDGCLDRDDLDLIPGRHEPGHADELCAAGLWQATAGGWLVVDFAVTQTSRDELEVLENARRREREKKARQRARAAASPEGRVPGTAQEGQARQEGQAEQASTESTDDGGSRVGKCSLCGHREPLTDDGVCSNSVACHRARAAS